MMTLQYPQYIHLRINAARKQMFIQRCEKDRNAFRIIYRKRTGNKDTEIDENSCYIYDRKLLLYLAGVIGVTEESPTLRYHGRLLPDEETVYIDLSQYEMLSTNSQEEDRALTEE
ncbi:MAG: hypothetical protein IKF90_22100 [Parasporobacterium sp.]|nr:hypothetical protein [Parasporobacterium sp.]